MPLHGVIDPGSPELTRPERRHISSSTFDFVVLNSSGFPEIAVEFDGPWHLMSKKKKRADIVKNRICHKEGIYQLRIGDFHLEQHERVVILEYMFSRFVNWQVEKTSIYKRIEEVVAELSEEKLKDLTRGGIADPSIDPTFLFDVEHPFPGIQHVQDRLRHRFGATFSLHPPKEQAEHLVYFFETSSSSTDETGRHIHENTYRLFGKVQHKARQEELHINERITASASAIWTVPIVEDYNGSESPAEYFERTGQIPISFIEIPGLTIPDLCETIADYAVLRAIENWLDKHACTPL